MVILWGIPDDGPLNRIRDILQQKNVPALFINQEVILEYTLGMNSDGDVSGYIGAPSSRVKIEDIHAIYLRPYDIRQLGLFEQCDPSDADWRQAIAFEDTMFLWCEIANACVINRPSSAASNASKPYQLELVRQSGFHVPATILTTDPQHVNDFRRKYGRVIYKSISCQRSIVSELSDDDEERLEDVVWCPTQFQEYVLGDDYRVHILGEKVFASRILSTSADYRYVVDTMIESVTLPDAIEEKCFRLTKNLGLHFSGIDLRRSQDDEWYCFEVNPSPGYTYFEDAYHQPISHALAEYLVRS